MFTTKMIEPILRKVYKWRKAVYKVTDFREMYTRIGSSFTSVDLPKPTFVADNSCN